MLLRLFFSEIEGTALLDDLINVLNVALCIIYKTKSVKRDTFIFKYYLPGQVPFAWLGRDVLRCSSLALMVAQVI